MFEYSIVRILGNELPPRDIIGNNIKSLNFILNNEPNFENCSKFWILNTIHDCDFKGNIINILNSHNQNYYELHFNRRSYAKSKTKLEKIRWGININAARNWGINYFRDKSKFIFILDGDCFFTESIWSNVISDIKLDNSSKKYYGVPGIRIVDNIPNNYNQFKLWEPSLVFRHDSDLLFNEDIPFSQNDKIELLRRIGYICQNGNTELKGDMCKNIGKLLHISFGDENLELNLVARMRSREKSINNLLNYIDHMPI